MLTTSCNSEASQPFCAVVKFAGTVVRRLGSFLLLLITLLLAPGVYAQSQTEIKNAEPSGTFGIVDTAEAKIVPEERWYTSPATEPGETNGV